MPTEEDRYEANLTDTQRHSAELSKVMGDPANKSIVEKLLAGDKEARATFDALASRVTGVEQPPPPAFPESTLSTLDLFSPDVESRLGDMVGTAGPDHTVPTPTPREQVKNIQYLRDAGFPDNSIMEMYDEGRTYTQQVHDIAKARLAEFQSDPAFVQRLFSGGFRERYLINCVARILSGGIAS